MQGVTKFVAFVALASFARGAPLRGRAASVLTSQSLLKLGNVTAKDVVSVHDRAPLQGIAAAEARARLVPDYITAAKAVYATPEEAFSATDTDQDGRFRVAEWNAESKKLGLDVTTTEALAPGWTAFQEMDADHDGFVSKEEFYAATSKYDATGRNTKEWREPAPASPTVPAYNDTDYKKDDLHGLATAR